MGRPRAPLIDCIGVAANLALDHHAPQPATFYRHAWLAALSLPAIKSLDSTQLDRCALLASCPMQMSFGSRTPARLDASAGFWLLPSGTSLPRHFIVRLANN